MRIFKFGGASICNAQNVRNVGNILIQNNYQDILIIASAMGKTTNALELVVNNYRNDPSELSQSLNAVRDFHYQIILDLFPDTTHPMFKELEDNLQEISSFLKNNKSPNYNFIYDQVVSKGEIISTRILHYYLISLGLENHWLDAKDLVETDFTYRDANVNWEQTTKKINELIQPKQLYITQGFIAADSNGFATTLGREGSDYSAAIFAYILNAESVTIWKDVPGVLNADPRYFQETTLLDEISYQEAIELAFYGATVIHPKTLQPLQNKEIPLYVRSFVQPSLKGTTVSKNYGLTPLVPCYIVKNNQLLISISSKDFSFIMEQNISDIFHLLHQYHIKVHVIQNSAISFTICVEDKFQNFFKLNQELQNNFKVSYNENVCLYTIRHFDPDKASQLLKDKTILLKHVNRETMQIVTK
ncbi:aspartate kinase [Myroides sp. LJL116]